jgi:hypothetical protein
MAIPTIVLFASATVTLVGVGPIQGLLVQHGLWPVAKARADFIRAVDVPVVATAPVPATAPQQGGTRGSTPARRGAAMDVFQVPASTPLLAQIRTTVSSATNEPDDEIRATLRAAVTQDGVELVPAGSVLHGKVVDVIPASPRQRRGQIAIAFYVIQHAETGSRASIATRVLTIDAASPDPAVVGKSAAKRPVDVQLPAGEAVTLTLAEPLIVRIPK